MLVNKKRLMHVSALFLCTVSLANAMEIANPSHMPSAISKSCQSKDLLRAQEMLVPPPLFLPLPISPLIDSLSHEERASNPCRVRERAPDAAGILLWSVDDNGVPVILMGERDDGKGWCGMGGSCDPVDKFPHVTAARETSEETMRCFSFPPELVAYMPYFDTQLSESGTCFRTYVTHCKMILESKLNELLKNAQGTSKEYEQFEWVPMADLIQMLNGITSSDESTIFSSSAAAAAAATPPIPAIPGVKKLAPDFAETLRQRPMLSTLCDIIKNPTAKKDEYVNALLGQKCEIMARAMKVQSAANQLPLPFRPFDKIAWQAIQEQEPAVFTQTHEQDDASASGFTSSSAAASAPHWSLTPSRAFLRLMLGDGAYVDGDDVGNLRKFFKKFPVTLESGKELFSGEGCEKELCILAQFLNFEEQEYKKGNLVGYHGLKGKFLFFYMYISALSSMLTGRNVVGFSPGLRNNHMAFFNLQTGKTFADIDEIPTLHVKAEADGYRSDHYGNENETLMLFVNPLLPLGCVCQSKPQFSESVTSSVALFFEDDNLGFFSFQNWAMETLIMLGMTPAYASQCIDELNSMYMQFFGRRENNGAMLALSVPQSLASTHTLLGEYNPGSRRSILDMYLDIFKKCEQGTEVPFLERTPEEQEEIRKLTTEARIYLDPAQMFKVLSSWRYPLLPEERRLFNAGLKMLVRIHALRLLRSNSRGMDHVFFTLLPSLSLQERFRHAYESSLKKPLSVPPINPDIFGYLVSHDYRNVIVDLLRSHQVKLNISAPVFHDNFLKSFLNYFGYFRLDLIRWVKSLQEYLDDVDRDTSVAAIDREKSFLKQIITDKDRKYVVACWFGDNEACYDLVFKTKEKSGIKLEDVQEFIELFKEYFDFVPVMHRGLEHYMRDHGDSGTLPPDIETVIRILYADELKKEPTEENQVERIKTLFNARLSQFRAQQHVEEEVRSEWTHSPELIEKLYDKSPEEFCWQLERFPDLARNVVNSVVLSKDNGLMAKIFSDKVVGSRIHPFKNGLDFYNFVANAVGNGIYSNSGLNAVREFLRTSVLGSEIGNTGITFGEWLRKSVEMDVIDEDLHEAIPWLGIS